MSEAEKYEIENCSCALLILVPQKPTKGACEPLMTFVNHTMVAHIFFVVNLTSVAYSCHIQ